MSWVGRCGRVFSQMVSCRRSGNLAGGNGIADAREDDVFAARDLKARCQSRRLGDLLDFCAKPAALIPAGESSPPGKSSWGLDCVVRHFEHRRTAHSRLPKSQKVRNIQPTDE